MGPAGPSKRRPILAPRRGAPASAVAGGGTARAAAPWSPGRSPRCSTDWRRWGIAGRTGGARDEGSRGGKEEKAVEQEGGRTDGHRFPAVSVPPRKTSRASAISRGWRLPRDDDKAARRQTTGPPCLGSYAVAAPANRCAKRVQRPGCRVSTSGRVGVHSAAAGGLAGSTGGVAVWQVVKKPRTSRSLLLGAKRTTRFRDVRVEPRRVRVEARGVRAEPRSVRGEARGVRGEARGVRGEARGVRGEARGVRGEARGVRVGARSVRARSWSRRAEGWQGTRGRRARDDHDGHEPHHS